MLFDMAVGLLIKPELDELIKNISNQNMYYGNKIPKSIMDMFVVEVREHGAGILVPYWIEALQRGRGPRRSSTGSGLVKRIFKWMSKNNMFESTTLKGKVNEARSMTWYINKYGNQQFRKKVFVDIWETERKKTLVKIDAKIDKTINFITLNTI